MMFLLTMLTSRFTPYIVAGLAVMGILGMVYWKGVSDQKTSELIANLQEQTRLLQEDVARKKKAAEEDAKKAEEDATAIADLEAKTKELTSELTDPSHQCLGADDTDRLLKLWD